MPFFIFSCKNENSTNSKTHNDSNPKIIEKESFINRKEDKIIHRYSVPKGFQRENYSQNEFGYYLQHLKLKDFGTLVKYYNGKEKSVFKLQPDYSLPSLQKRYLDNPMGIFIISGSRLFQPETNGDVRTAGIIRLLFHLFCGFTGDADV